MLDINTAPTLRELIAELQSWENQDQRVAYTIFTKEDIEGDADWYDFEGTVEDAWNKVADEFHSQLNEGWLMERLNEGLREVTGEHFPLKGE